MSKPLATGMQKLVAGLAILTISLLAYSLHLSSQNRVLGERNQALFKDNNRLYSAYFSLEEKTLHPFLSSMMIGMEVEIVPVTSESGFVKIALPNLDGFGGNSQVGKFFIQELEIELTGVGNSPRRKTNNLIHGRYLVIPVGQGLSGLSGVKFIHSAGGERWSMEISHKSILVPAR